MGWQYRVCKETWTGILGGENYSEVGYSFREVHSDKPNATPKDEISFSKEARSAFGESVEELKATLEMMQKAFDLPVLDLDKWKKLREE